MLLGFISLLLTVAQNGITKICVPVGWTNHMLPCSLEEKEIEESKKPISHFQTFFSFEHIARRLLADRDEHESPTDHAKVGGYCAAKVFKTHFFCTLIHCSKLRLLLLLQLRYES